MRLLIPAASLLALAFVAPTSATQPPASRAMGHSTPLSSETHNIDDPRIVWGPAPAIFPPGAQMAVMQGDPASQKLFTVRLRFPSGYRIAPHTHPTDEHVTVVSGTFRVGMGTTASEKEMTTLTAGGFVTAPANHPHFAEARGTTIVQVHAMGPFAMTYVNPADTPKAAASR